MSYLYITVISSCQKEQRRISNSGFYKSVQNFNSPKGRLCLKRLLRKENLTKTWLSLMPLVANLGCAGVRTQTVTRANFCYDWQHYAIVIWVFEHSSFNEVYECPKSWNVCVISIKDHVWQSCISSSCQGAMDLRPGHTSVKHFGPKSVCFI